VLINGSYYFKKKKFRPGAQAPRLILLLAVFAAVHLRLGIEFFSSAVFASN
jgi:hypothetical protein